MNNKEIKEILNDLQRVADRKCNPEDILDGSIAQEWIDYIDDYITNLQEGIKKLNDVIETLKETNHLLIIQKYKLEYELDMLDNKRDKAIEYIKENACYGKQEKCCLDDLNYNECDELLEILGDKGE